MTAPDDTSLPAAGDQSAAPRRATFTAPDPDRAIVSDDELADALAAQVPARQPPTEQPRSLATSAIPTQFTPPPVSRLVAPPSAPDTTAPPALVAPAMPAPALRTGEQRPAPAPRPLAESDPAPARSTFPTTPASTLAPPTPLVPAVPIVPTVAVVSAPEAAPAASVTPAPPAPVVPSPATPVDAAPAAPTAEPVAPGDTMDLSGVVFRSRRERREAERTGPYDRDALAAAARGEAPAATPEPATAAAAEVTPATVPDAPESLATRPPASEPLTPVEGAPDTRVEAAPAALAAVDRAAPTSDPVVPVASALAPVALRPAAPVGPTPEPAPVQVEPGDAAAPTDAPAAPASVVSERPADEPTAQPNVVEQPVAVPAQAPAEPVAETAPEPARNETSDLDRAVRRIRNGELPFGLTTPEPAEPRRSAHAGPVAPATPVASQESFVVPPITASAPAEAHPQQSADFESLLAAAQTAWAAPAALTPAATPAPIAPHTAAPIAVAPAVLPAPTEREAAAPFATLLPAAAPAPIAGPAAGASVVDAAIAGAAEVDAPDVQRPGRASGVGIRQLWIWAAPTLSLAGLAVGGLLVGSGASLRQALIAVVVGLALSAVPVAVTAALGRRSGRSAAEASAATFGTAGAPVPAVLSMLTRAVWAGGLLWLLARSFAEVLAGSGLIAEADAGVTGLAAAAGGFVLALAASLASPRVLQWVLLGVTGLGIACAALVIAFTAPAVDLDVARGIADGPWLLVATGAVLVFSIVGAAWAPGAGDLARDDQLQGRPVGAVVWAAVGVTVPALVLVGWGAVLTASSEQIATGMLLEPFDTVGRLMPLWYPAPLLVGLGLPLVAGVALAIRSGGTALRALGPLPAAVTVPPVAALAAASAAGLVLAAPSLQDAVRDLATTLAVPVVAWLGLLVADLGARRSTSATPGLRVAPLVALVVLTAVGWGLTVAAPTWLSWQGYLYGLLGVDLGSDLAAADLGVLVAFGGGLLVGLVTGLVSRGRMNEDDEAVAVD